MTMAFGIRRLVLALAFCSFVLPGLFAEDAQNIGEFAASSAYESLFWFRVLSEKSTQAGAVWFLINDF